MAHLLLFFSRPISLQIPFGNTYATQECRFRTTYGGIKGSEKGLPWKWYRIEEDVEFQELDDPKRKLQTRFDISVTVFHPEQDDETDSEEEGDQEPVEALIADTRSRSYTRTPFPHALRSRKKLKLIEICTATLCMTIEAAARGWTGLPPLTIETGYDLLTTDGRSRAKAQLCKDLPDVIVAEWPCDPFCSWTHVNKGKGDETEQRILEKQQAHIPLIKWIADIEKWQTNRGKIFVGEQPSSCASWKLAATQDMQRRNYNTILDMCQFGLKDPFDKRPYRHRTKLVHNSPGVHRRLSKLCPGTHEHAVTGGNTYIRQDGAWKSIDKSKFAGWYTKKFCNAVLDGIEEDMSSHFPYEAYRVTGRKLGSVVPSRLPPEVNAYLLQVEHHPGWHVNNKGYPVLVTHNAIVHRSVAPQYAVCDWPYRSSYVRNGNTWHSVEQRVPYGNWDDCFHELPLPHASAVLVTVFEPRLFDTYPAEKRSLPLADKTNPREVILQVIFRVAILTAIDGLKLMVAAVNMKSKNMHICGRARDVVAKKKITYPMLPRLLSLRMLLPLVRPRRTRMIPLLLTLFKRR